MMDDLDRLMLVMDAAFEPHWREAWSRRQVEDSLLHPHTYALLVAPSGEACRTDEAAAGFVLVRKAPGEEELLLIAVDPLHRGKGLGRRLIELFLATARGNGAESVFLEMRENNPAQALYRAAGFMPIGRRKAYYRTLDGEALDAVTFGLKL